MRTLIANLLDRLGTRIGAFGWRLTELAQRIDPIQVEVVNLDSTDVKHLLWEGDDD